MNKRRKSFLVGFMVFALLIGQAAMNISAEAQTIPKKPIKMKAKKAIQHNSNRIFGQTRYETAVAIAKEYFAQSYSEPSHTVILVNGENYPDALSAGPLGGVCGAPILLTKANVLTPVTLQALKDLKITKVIIVGGTIAISTEVENAVKALSIATERIAGEDRYSTCVKVAYKIESIIGEPSQVVAVASGMGFADAISIGPVAAAGNMPILLTRDKTIPSEVQDYINKNQEIIGSFVVGGNLVISDGVKNKFPNAVRLGGDDRYETNLKVLECFNGLIDYDTVYLSSGLNYADALAGAVLAGNYMNPIVLVNKTVSDNTKSFIGNRLTGFSDVIALGGVSVVPDAAISDVENSITQDGIDVSKDFLEMKVGYAPGDSAKSVTGNLTLPTTGKYGSTITWISDNPEIISNTGVVTRPVDEDKEVSFWVLVNKGQSYYFDIATFIVKKK